MPVKVTGQAELSRRLTALGVTPQAVRDAWAAETLRLARARVRVASGRTQRSIRVASLSAKGARFQVSFGGLYLEKGTPPHVIRPKGSKPLRFMSNGQTIFSRKVDHPRSRRHPFMVVSARAALRGLKKEIAALWDGAA